MASQAVSKLGITRAKLTAYKPKVATPKGGARLHKASRDVLCTLDFEFNPTSMSFSRKFIPAAPPTQSGPPPSGAGQTTAPTHKLNLYLSVWDADRESGKRPDLEKIKQQLFQLVDGYKDPADKTKPAIQPFVEFSWGEITIDHAHMTEVTITWEQFLPGGKPARMKADITLTEAAREVAKTNPTSGGRTNRRTHLVLAGETLAGVAYQELSDSSLWRAIAEENGIDDPMRLRAGTELLLPSPEELT